MKLTNYLKLKKPEAEIDNVLIEDINENSDSVDKKLEEIDKKVEENGSAIGQMAYNLISNEEIDSMEPITGLPVGGGGDLGDATPIQNGEIDNVLIN